MEAATTSPWESTAVQNLFRYRPSGTYFARFKVGGRPVRQSLNTAVFSVAKQRLADKLREHRARNESVKAFASGRMSVEAAAEAYVAKLDANVSLKPRSKAYNRMLVGFIRRSWPALFEMDVRKVTERDCEAWLSGYAKKYAPT